MVYIIINIIISALTTLTVLWLWERAHPTPKAAQPVTSTPAVSDEMFSSESMTTHPSSENTLDSNTEDTHVIIRTVVGAGNLEAEYVEITNQSAGAVDLTGWQLVDEEGQKFTFPALLLNNEGKIEVHSKAGDHTVIELYWRADQPIWQSGEIVKLINAEGEIMATYSIP